MRMEGAAARKPPTRASEPWLNYEDHVLYSIRVDARVSVSERERPKG